jgi:hypothetical protein
MRSSEQPESLMVGLLPHLANLPRLPPLAESRGSKGQVDASATSLITSAALGDPHSYVLEIIPNLQTWAAMAIIADR